MDRRIRVLRSALAHARHPTQPPDERPLVTVVIATFNWSTVLPFSIGSALRQTYANLELLVVGDACTDDSAEVVAAAAAGDERVRWWNLEENSGSQSGPNQAAIDQARGEYIAYLGHDDLWHPSHLATLVTALQRSRADLAYGLCEVVGPPGSRLRYLSGEPAAAAFSLGTHIPPTSIVHTADLGRRIGWRHYLETAESPDMDFADRVAESGAEMIRVNALTSFKFPASHRPNSYIDKPTEQQTEYTRRMEAQPRFLERQLGRVLLRKLLPGAPRVPVAVEPAVPEPGWRAKFARRTRGLE
jgi:glycosyltransferase involved in cell wall biosynthesis